MTIRERWVLWSIVAVTAVLLSPLVMVSPDTLFGESQAFVGYPYLVAKHLVFTLHDLPLWNPFSGAGEPLLEYPLAGQFYPPMWLTFLFTHDTLAIRWMAYLHLLAAAAGAYTLARWVGASRLAACLVPTGYLFNPWVTQQLANGVVQTFYAMALTPWGLACLWRGAMRDDRRWLLGSAICLAGQILAGTTYEMQFTLLASAIIIALAAATAERPWPLRVWQMIRHVCWVFGFAAGVGAIKLLPILQYAPYTTRTRFDIEVLEWVGMEYGGFTTWPEIGRLITQFFGPQPSWLGGWVNIAYAAAVLWLAWSARRPSPFRRPALIFGALTVLVGWIAMGPRAPLDLFEVLCRVMPNFRYTPYADRVLSIAYLTFPLLAALGVTQAQGGAQQPEWTG
ncbi:MAG: hypothetical protein HY600_02115 [Candidatus Omnitrophica bacterium]|nr:hypothetical protein [Candidatus Omnitrophota bacterium]